MVMDSNQKTIKGAQSVYRVLNILEEVILCGDRMITPKELSASLDIPVATVHRLLMVLRQKNFVACDPATKKYHIGDSCLISPRMDVAAFIRARFLPLAERISRRFGYSTILYARSGYDAVCVERLDGWHPIQVFLNKTGDRRPLGMGSATLSILAAMPEDEDAQALLGLCYTLARRQGEAEAVLAPLAAGEGPRAELAAGLLEKLRQEP